MQLHRRDMLKMGLVGIPGLVLLPIYLKPETQHTFRFIKDRNIRGNITLRDGDFLVDCIVSGKVVLDGHHVVVDGCRIGKGIEFTERCTDHVSVTNNYIEVLPEQRIAFSRRFFWGKTNTFSFNICQGRPLPNKRRVS